MRDIFKIDKSAISLLVGGMVVVLLLMASVFVYNVENPSIAQRRVAQILETPNTFYNSTVTVSGEVEKVFDTQALTVDGPGAVGDQLLVVSRDPLEPIGGSGIPQALFSPLDTVSVEGQVKEFDIKTVEKELGVDLDDQKYSAWQGRPYILASQVRTVSE